MFDLSGTDGVMDIAVGKPAERSGAGFPTVAGGRSIASGSSKAVAERDCRRSFGTSPNSRQSRLRRHVASSSHLQDRDISMDGSITSFVGIDVAEDSLDVRVLSEAKPFTVSVDRRRGGLGGSGGDLPAGRDRYRPRVQSLARPHRGARGRPRFRQVQRRWIVRRCQFRPTLTHRQQQHQRTGRRYCHRPFERSKQSLRNADRHHR